jgi:hypothetical protein
MSANQTPAVAPESLPIAREVQAARMLLHLTDKHGARARHMAETLGYLAYERPGLGGIEDLAIALADHVVGLARGVEEIREMLNGREPA